MSTGDPLLDYCLSTFGLFYRGMAERYKTVNAVLKGNMGQLVLAQWNERLEVGFRRHFTLGVLSADALQFPHKLNCIIPIDGYVTHEDIPENGVLHPGGFDEGAEFFVPADIFKSFGSLAVIGSVLEEYTGRHDYRVASVIAGDEAVRSWFKWDRCGVPGGNDTCRRLEERLRASKSQPMVTAV